MPTSPTLEASQSERKDPEKVEKGSIKEDSENDEEGDMKESLSQDCETGEEEGRKAVGRKGPKMPTKMEQEEHARTHCSYRSWCRHCVQARAMCSPHRAGEKIERERERKRAWGLRRCRG